MARFSRMARPVLLGVSYLLWLPASGTLVAGPSDELNFRHQNFGMGPRISAPRKDPGSNETIQGFQAIGSVSLTGPIQANVPDTANVTLPMPAGANGAKVTLSLSPSDGSVSLSKSEVHVNPGETVSEGFTVFNIGNTADVTLRAVSDDNQPLNDTLLQIRP